MKQLISALSFIAVVRSYAVTVEDQASNCKALVASGKCMTDKQKMEKICHTSCSNWQDRKLQRIPFSLENEEKKFYEIIANNATGYPVDFDRFDGYITVVMTVTKTCADSKIAPEAIFYSIEKFQSVWPYSLQVLVIPYKHPKINYDEKDCKNFEKEMIKPERRINVMEMGDLNGPSANPIISYLKKAMKVKILDEDTTLYFIIDSDGLHAEHHYGKSLQDIKDALSHLMKGYEL